VEALLVVEALELVKGPLLGGALLLRVRCIRSWEPFWEDVPLYPSL